MLRRIQVFLLTAILCIATSPAQADENWQFQIAPYVWTAGLEGGVATLPGVPAASVEASFIDILEKLDVAFMIAGEAHNGRAGLGGCRSSSISRNERRAGGLYWEAGA